MEFLAGLTLGVKDKPTELIFKFLTSEKDEFIIMTNYCA